MEMTPRLILVTLNCVSSFVGPLLAHSGTFHFSRDAFAYVYSRRGCVTPYESFLHQLGELEPILKAKADVEKAAADEASTAGAGADTR